MRARGDAMAGESRYTVNATAVPAAAGVNASGGVNPKRVGLVVSAPVDTQDLELAFVCDNGAELKVYFSSNPLVEFWYSRHGPLVSKAWELRSFAGVSPASVLEIIDNEL